LAIANRNRGAVIVEDAVIGDERTLGAERARDLCEERREEEDATVRAVRVAIGTPL
jgi:hypothetical protein